MSLDEQHAWNAALYGDITEGSEFSASSDAYAESERQDSVSPDNDSCLAVAEGVLYGSSLKANEDQISKENLQAEVMSMAENDVEFQTVLNQWQNCMTEHGLEFDRPGDAEQTLYQNYVDGAIDMDTLRQSEIEIAKIDALCFSQHGVAEAFNEAMQRSEVLLTDMHSEQIEELRQSLHAALNRAESHMQ